MIQDRAAEARMCPTCGRSLGADETHCPVDHGVPGGVFGLPRAAIEATPRARRHLLGLTIDQDFVVTGFLGSGGFGAVYRAHQRSLDRVVALKLLTLDQVGDQPTVERFKREARTAASLMDPNIATLFAYGEARVGDGPHDRLIFMAMELVEGPTLAEFIRQTRGADLATTFHIGRNLLRGLAAAHDRGVVHRDLKPGNVVLDTGKGRAWFARLIDFGIASLQAPGQTTLRSAGMVLGTPKYMAPEQWRSQETTPATDIYAFGALLVEILTGKPAVAKAEPRVMYAAHCEGPRPQVAHTGQGQAVPEELQVFIQRCMAVDPKERFQSARDALMAFEILAAGEGFEDGSVSATPTELLRAAQARLQRLTPPPGTPPPGGFEPDFSPSLGLHTGEGLDGLPLTPRHPGEVDMARAVDALPEAPPPPAGDEWLQAWGTALGDQAEAQVKHLPGPGVKAVAAPLMPEAADAEFSFGPPGVDDPPPVRAASQAPASQPLPALSLQSPAPQVPAAQPLPAPQAPAAQALPAPQAPAPPPAKPGSGAPRRPPAAHSPGPLRDSDADESWGVAGAEMLGPDGKPQRGGRSRRAGSGELNLVPVALGLVVILAGLGVWRMLAHDEVAEAAAGAVILQPTVSAGPAAPAVLPPDAGAEASPQAGVDKRDRVLVRVRPAGVRFLAEGEAAPICDDADRCWLQADVDHRLEKRGYKTHKISGDDLFDRKGGKLDVVLQPER